MNNFEDHIRNKLENHTSPVDTDALWDSIRDDIPKKEDKEKSRLFFVLFGIGLVCGMTFIFHNPSYQKEFPFLSDRNTVESRLAEDIYYENNIDISSSEDMMSPVFGYHSADLDGDYNVAASNSKPTISAGFNADMAFNHSTISSERDNINIPAMQDYVILIETKKTAPIAEENIIAQENKQQEVVLAAIENVIIHEDNYEEIVDLLDAEVFAMDDEVVEEILFDEKIAEKIKKKRVNFFLGATIGSSISDVRYSSNSGRHKEYTKQRRELEKYKSTTSFSLDMGVLLNDKIRLRTGVEYTRMKSKAFWYEDVISFTFETNDEDSEEKIPEPNPDDKDKHRDKITDFTDNYGGGEPENGNEEGDKEIFSNKEKRFQSINQYSFIDIPLVLGYEVRKKKLALLLEGGLNLRFHAASEGYVLQFYPNDDNSYVNIKVATNPTINKSMNVGIYLGTSVMYDLNDHTQLKIGGDLKSYPFSVGSKNSPINQTLHSVGIHMGIYHQL